jgi:hypothetical protein
LNLKDISGPRFVHILRNNTSLRELELSANQLAYETCSKLAESLLANTNSSIRFLSLESNPLSIGEKQEFIVLVMKAIGAGLSFDRGQLLAEAITTRASNSKLGCSLGSFYCLLGW